MRSAGLIAAVVTLMGMSTLTAQVYRPVQGIGLPETERRGTEITLPGVEDLEGTHQAAPQQTSVPDSIDTSIWPDIKELLGATWNWITRAAGSVWESLTWWR